MGKTQKPLRIGVEHSLLGAPAILELAAKGHEIVEVCLGDCDVVFAPNAWRMDATLLPYLDLAIKGARGVKYPKGKK